MRPRQVRKHDMFYCGIEVAKRLPESAAVYSLSAKRSNDELHTDAPGDG